MKILTIKSILIFFVFRYLWENIIFAIKMKLYIKEVYKHTLRECTTGKFTSFKIHMLRFLTDIMKYNNRYVNGIFNSTFGLLQMFKIYPNRGLDHSGLYIILDT